MGVGGGKTALVSLAKTLSMAGHRVEVCSYVREGRFDGVDYIDEQRTNRLEADVLLVSTSSKMDLSKLKRKEIEADLRFLWLHGVSPITGMEGFDWSGLICVSHYVKDHFTKTSKIPKERFSVIHNGVDLKDFKPWYGLIRRNPYGIVFASHPIKGLDQVLRLIRALREEISPHFFLDVYGGYQLWGLDGPPVDISTDGASFKGIIPQPQLIRRLFSYNFMINIYDLPEGFGLIYPQALKAGVVCLASNVGGVSEVIQDGRNGFLLNWPSETESVLNEVKQRIAYLLKERAYLNRIRKNAMSYNRGWEEVARDFLCLFKSKAMLKDRP